MQEEMRKRDLRQHGQTYLLTMMLYFQKMALWRVVCTGVPYVGAFRDAQNYIRANSRGLGIYELPEYLAWPDWDQWDELVTYLNSKRSRI